MIEIIISITLYVSFLGFAAKRLLTYLHAFQQEEYNETRFLSWMFGNMVIDRIASALILIATLGWVAAGTFDIPTFIPLVVVFAAFVSRAAGEADPRSDAKKKLAMTARAKRVYTTALSMSAFIGLIGFITPAPLIWLAPVHLIPITLVLANILLEPFEQSIQQTYWNEARERLKEVNPTIIAITGSFGKTSVKHILGHVLKSNANVLITPGSVNTVMGISRIIREELQDDTQYLVVEMGAYGPGSIRKLCELTPPDIGIITAIGHAHYERFKSLETVADAKYELAEAVIAKGGRMIVHDKTLEFAKAKRLQTENPSTFLTVGEDKTNNMFIKRKKQTDRGLEIKAQYADDDYEITCPLYGIQHVSNIALAFTTARAIDISPDNIVAALKSVPQIPHRLEVKRQPDGRIIIDDAFNSNPLGFQSALDLLTSLNPQSRKILITPGMVELGSSHDTAHENIGTYAGQVCDVAIIVNSKRIPTFINGFKTSGANKELREVNTFTEAQSWVNQNKQDGDIILIENDLPDVYERIPRL